MDEKLTPAPKPQSNEQRYYDALKRIARDYRSARSLIELGDCGIPGDEAMEYAYENIQDEADRAIRGKRRPKQ